MLNNLLETSRITQSTDDGSPDFYMDDLYMDSSPEFPLPSDSFSMSNRAPPVIIARFKINSRIEVVQDWSQSWNPANGGPIKYIDINCLERVKNVMQYFRYDGSDVHRESTDFDDKLKKWLLDFILDRHPYDLLYGSVFLHQPQAFMYKKRSFSSTFQPLETLGDDEISKFSETLFISWNVLTMLFEGLEISDLFSNVRNNKRDYIYRIQRLQTKRGAPSNGHRLRSARKTDTEHTEERSGDFQLHATEDSQDSSCRRSKRRRNNMRVEIIPKDEK